MAYRWLVHPVALLPSPTRNAWYLGPVPIRAYALCIVAGIIIAIFVTIRRFKTRGGTEDDVWNVAGWAVLLGILGGRLYHVITDGELYFGKGKNPLNALKIWDGGLGIWGAVALGALGVWIGCRRHGIRFTSYADACAPAVLIAQAVGRWGNWFNNELYGGHTSVPWGLQVHCMDVTAGHAVSFGTADGGQSCAGSSVVAGLFQPTFLYESLWDIAIALLVIYLDRRFRMGRGTVLALYVAGYTAGRFWIEALRTDPAHHFLGLRLNDWTALICFLVAIGFFVSRGGFRSGREDSPYTDERARADADAPEAVAASGTSGDPGGEGEQPADLKD